jgi:hypothetical protein
MWPSPGVRLNFHPNPTPGVWRHDQLRKYRKKAYTFESKAALGVRDYGAAVQLLEQAKALLAEEGDAELKTTEGKEVAALLQQALKSKAAEERQEKARWQKVGGSCHGLCGGAAPW